MKIAICHQNKVERFMMRRICMEYYQNSCQVYEFTDEDTLSESCIHSYYDVIILRMNTEGIYVKNILQKRRIASAILFVASKDADFTKAFGKYVYGCLELPVKKDVLCRLLGQITDDTADMTRVAFSDIHGSYQSMLMQDIVSIHAEANYTILTTMQDHAYLIRRSMKQWMDELDARFLQIHRSYIVNMDYVDAICEDICLKNGQHLPVSKAKMQSVKKCYDLYHGLS